MSSSPVRRIKSWLQRSRQSGASSSVSVDSEPAQTQLKLTDSVQNYYRHKAQTNLSVFYRFALQTQSIKIRDTFAAIASSHNLSFSGLLGVLENYDVQELTPDEKHAARATFNPEILLTLATLIANTSQNDLDAFSAVQLFDFAYSLFGETSFDDQHKLQYVEVLHEVGRYHQADLLAQKYEINKLAPLQTQLFNLQRIRLTDSSESGWIEALNGLYESLGMSAVRFTDDTALPLMDRLASGVWETVIEGPKVSVIMPTFSPGYGIKTAIRGLLEQTWKNLEIIVVDDASPEEFRDLFQEISQMDPRIQVVHQQKNSGAYVARNTGLEIATGDFITTHDDDDWSHPDKIATQVQSILSDGSIVASTSAHIRSTEKLEFRRMNIQAKFLQMNYSSLMFRKSVVEDIGEWDEVNRGGDSEFYTRLVEFYGEERIISLHDKPYSLSRVWQGSLTSGEMARGYFAYSRLLYRWSFRQWHWNQYKLGQRAIRTNDVPRPYAIPTDFEAGKRNKDLGFFDVIYVTDFFRQSKYVDFVLNEIASLSDSGLKVGYMHLYSPETTRPAGIPPRLFELQLANKVTQVSHTDKAEVKLLVVYDSAIGMYADQIRASVVTHRGIIVEHGLPTLSGGEARRSSNLKMVLGHLDKSFGTSFQIVGATYEDQARLQTILPKTRVPSDDLVWHQHVREKPGQIQPPSGKPVVGFHSFGNQYRWPANESIFRSIYISDEYDTYLYGHLERPMEKFGQEVFDLVTVIDNNEETHEDFLERLDFWVYWPHHRLRDQVWDPVLAALQAGKVVILPERLSSIYGDACVYSDKNSVETLVANLTNHPDEYVAQATRGQHFINAKHTERHLQDRVEKLSQRS